MLQQLPLHLTQLELTGQHQLQVALQLLDTRFTSSNSMDNSHRILSIVMAQTQQLLATPTALYQ